MLEKEKITIAVHSGSYHADDVFAVATLFLALEKKFEISVIRTRDNEVIRNADYGIDVGNIYNESINRFDHHQIGGAGVRENGIPYASFGLVWKKYGQQLCGDFEIFKKIDKKIVQPIDAIDNGIEIIGPLFKDVYPYNFYDFLDVLAPTWKEEDNLDEIFLLAISYAKIVLNREIKKEKDKKEANQFVIEEYNRSEDKRLVIFDKYYPSGDALIEFKEPLYKIYPRREGTWVLESIKINRHSFDQRKPLPENWAGKSDQELEKATGVTGSLFCHNGRFLIVAKTREVILKLAEIALNS